MLHDAIEEPFCLNKEPFTSEESFCCTKGSLWRKKVLQIIKRLYGMGLWHRCEKPFKHIYFKNVSTKVTYKKTIRLLCSSCKTSSPHTHKPQLLLYHNLLTLKLVCAVAPGGWRWLTAPVSPKIKLTPCCINADPLMQAWNFCLCMELNKGRCDRLGFVWLLELKVKYTTE